MNLIPVAKNMVLVIILTSALSLAVGLFFSAEKLYYVFGILFGTLISIARIYLINRTINKIIGMPPAKAKLYATGQYYLRLFLTFGVMLAGALLPFVSLIGTIIGVFSYNVAAYAGNFINRKNKALAVGELGE